MRGFVVDDDSIMVELLTKRLIDSGHQVTGFQSSTEGFRAALANPPDFILVDIMMPELDGLEFCRRIRLRSELAATRIIVVTAKGYDFDRRQAAVVGANGYIAKPIGPNFLDELEPLLLPPAAELRYWGVRGTLPVSGADTLRYGGNTSCVTMQFGREHLFIFDAGTGIRLLGSHLMGRQKRISAHLFVSHPHWDHINALPFFAPLYVAGNEFDIVGASHGEISMSKLIGDQMDSIYFPVTMREFSARVNFRDISEQQFDVDGVTVRTMLLSHPGRCLGYRIETGGRAFCYVTDNELFPTDLPQHDAHYTRLLTSFVRDADVLITDTTYADEVYRKRIGWGHSGIGEVTRLAHKAGVKALHLFHHDPDQTDDDIDRKFEQAQAHLSGLASATRCLAPAEGDSFSIPLVPTMPMTAPATV